MDRNFNYNKNLKTFARENRKSMTWSEARLWKHTLSRRKMKGYKFRRQRPIGNFIADFVCLPLGLIIEVDGITHLNPKKQAADLKRDQKLKSLGFVTLRFSALLVLINLEFVAQEIEDWIDKNANCPPPAPRQPRKSR